MEDRLSTLVVDRGHIYPIVELLLDGKKISEQTGMDWANWMVEDGNKKYLVQYGRWGAKAMLVEGDSNE